MMQIQPPLLLAATGDLQLSQRLRKAPEFIINT
jgi:hypothetical protein